MKVGGRCAGPVAAAEMSKHAVRLEGSRSAVRGRACALRRHRHVDRATGIPVRTAVVARSTVPQRAAVQCLICASPRHSHPSLSFTWTNSTTTMEVSDGTR